VIELAFLDVGNADSIVVTKLSTPAIVIDVPYPRKVEDWLDQYECQDISAVFFTHNHRDHIPSLINLVTFLGGWLKKGTIAQVYIPLGYIDHAIASADDPKSQQKLRHAMDKLNLWDGRSFSIEGAAKRHSPIKLGDIEMRLLHPSMLFIKQYKRNNQRNELSLVLRLEYGDFNALLLADIEGGGLEKLLNYTDDNELKCNVMKIPHHGAWQKQNSKMLRELFDKADTEFAVLSVGSTNPHGHVVSELFRELLKRQNDNGTRLTQFVCTEITRTCVHTAAQRQSMNNKGLEHKRPCVGNVVVQAQRNGSWTFKMRAVHQTHLQKVERPACLGQADL